MLNKDVPIVRQVLAGVLLKDALHLAEEFEKPKTEAGYWSASRLYYSIAISVVGLDADEKCNYFLKALACSAHVGTKAHPGALSVEYGARTKMIWHNRSEEEVRAQAAGMIAMANMNAADVHPDDMRGWNNNNIYVACLLFGQFKSAYSLQISLAQVKEGVRLGLDGYAFACSRKVVDSLPASFDRWISLEFSLYPVGCQTIYLVELSKLQEYIISVCGELDVRAREISEMYHLCLILFCILAISS
jgi:hypothetical protein